MWRKNGQFILELENAFKLPFVDSPSFSIISGNHEHFTCFIRLKYVKHFFFEKQSNKIIFFQLLLALNGTFYNLKWKSLPPLGGIYSLTFWRKNRKKKIIRTDISFGYSPFELTPQIKRMHTKQHIRCQKKREKKKTKRKIKIEWDQRTMQYWIKIEFLFSWIKTLDELRK